MDGVGYQQVVFRARCVCAKQKVWDETEFILRRFTRKNSQHPAYKAFVELDKAINSIFLCRDLHDESLRWEINERLNVVEQ
jgi:TnpA family transposase